MPRVHSFEPVIGVSPRILILGSMPGVISLQATQYYGNPRNAFWLILSELFGINVDCDYEQRVEQASQLPLILWDTIKACHREGSLDSSIQKHQLEANDISALLSQYPSVRLVVFNGATSEKYFRQLVKPELPEGSDLAFIKMPSTSPANAGSSFEQKLTAWSELLKYL